MLHQSLQKSRGGAAKIWQRESNAIHQAPLPMLSVEAISVELDVCFELMGYKVGDGHMVSRVDGGRLA